MHGFVDINRYMIHGKDKNFRKHSQDTASAIIIITNIKKKPFRVKTAFERLSVLIDVIDILSDLR